MLMIKGALFDIDDTLYSHKIKDVPALTLRALDELRKKNIKIGICTSRRTAEMQFLPDELIDRIDCEILATGAITLVKDKYYKAYTLNYADTIRYIEYFKRNNISYNYSDINGDIYFWGDTSLITDKKALRLVKKKILIKEYEEEEITDLFFYNATDKQVEEIINYSIFEGLASYAIKYGVYGRVNNEKAVQLMLRIPVVKSAGVIDKIIANNPNLGYTHFPGLLYLRSSEGKARTIKSLLNQIDVSDVYTIGDSINDLEMLSSYNGFKVFGASLKLFGKGINNTYSVKTLIKKII